MGAFAEMSGDVSRICDITAHDLAQTHVSYYNDDTKRTKGKYSSAPRRPGGLGRNDIDVCLLFFFGDRTDHSTTTTKVPAYYTQERLRFQS